MVSLRENIVDRSFDPTFIQSCHLVLHISDSRLSFVVTGPQHKIVVFRVYELSDFSEMKNVLSDDELLRKNYASARIYFSNRLTTLIPESLFDSSSTELLLSSVTNIPSSFNTSYQKVEDLDMVLIFAYDKDSYTYFAKHHSSLKVEHASASLISHLIRNHSTNESAHLIFHQRNVEIVCIKDQQLILHNAFHFQSISDLVYYVLHCFKQIELDTQKIETTLYGDITRDSELFKLLYRYIRHLSFFSGFTGQRKNLITTIEPSHFYFDVLCQLP